MTLKEIKDEFRAEAGQETFCEDISNSQQYKCYGNAVNVEVIKHIMQILWKTA